MIPCHALPCFLRARRQGLTFALTTPEPVEDVQPKSHGRQADDDRRPGPDHGSPQNGNDEYEKPSGYQRKPGSEAPYQPSVDRGQRVLGHAFTRPLDALIPSDMLERHPLHEWSGSDRVPASATLKKGTRVGATIGMKEKSAGARGPHGRGRSGKFDRIGVRHRRLLEHFGESGVARERQRYRQTVGWQYRLELVQRFLNRHFTGRRGSCLEIGPGAGRFSPFLACRSRRLVLFDLSLPMLEASRTNLRSHRRGSSIPQFVQGSLENLPFTRASFDRVVALGVLPFVARDVGAVLKNLAGLLRPEGKLVFEIHTPSQDTMTIFPVAPAGAKTILRDPARYYLWSVIRRGYQPYDPLHFARFEVAWLRPGQLARELDRAGMRAIDQMAIGPNFSNHPQLLRHIRRDPRAYANALRLEEETGRWPELLGAGAGLLVAAQAS